MEDFPWPILYKNIYSRNILYQITVTSDQDIEKEAEEATNNKENKEASPVEPKPVYSDSESSDEEDERELQGRTYSDKGVEVRKL